MAIVAQVSGVAHEPLVIFYSQHMHVQKLYFFNQFLLHNIIKKI